MHGLTQLVIGVVLMAWTFFKNLFAPSKESHAMAKVMSASEVQAAAAAAGIDWGKLIQFVQQQGIPFILALIAALRQQPVMTGSAGGAGGDQMAHLKAHFEAIGELADCGAACCGD